jgi:hypothetical protein
MTQYSKLILVGIILVVFGVTLVATSYFKIFDTIETVLPTAGALPIQANSSSDFYFNFFYGPLPKSQKILVLVAGSNDLQGILNSTLNYSSTIEHPQNITISILDGNQNLSTTENTWTLSQTYLDPVAFHTFDIPDSWSFGSGTEIGKVSVTNPENYPVCWIVNVMLYGQVINDGWLTVFFVGIVPIILGLIIIGVAAHKRKPDVKKET